MIAEYGIDRSLDTTECFSIVAFQDRAHAHVNDVATNEHQVRLLGIDDVGPSLQLSLTVMVAYVQVAGKDNGQWLLQWLLGRDGQLLTLFVVILHTTQRHHHGHNAYNSE